MLLTEWHAASLAQRESVVPMGLEAAPTEDVNVEIYGLFMTFVQLVVPPSTLAEPNTGAFSAGATRCGCIGRCRGWWDDCDLVRLYERLPVGLFGPGCFGQLDGSGRGCRDRTGSASAAPVVLICSAKRPESTSESSAQR